jgi:hypothetical protein
MLYSLYSILSTRNIFPLASCFFPLCSIFLQRIKIRRYKIGHPYGICKCFSLRNIFSLASCFFRLCSIFLQRIKIRCYKIGHPYGICKYLSISILFHYSLPATFLYSLYSILSTRNIFPLSSFLFLLSSIFYFPSSNRNIFPLASCFFPLKKIHFIN